MKLKANLCTKILSFLLCSLLVLPMFLSIKTVSAQSQESEITVFSVEDYIDESIFETFYEQTGITVNYLTFATNEAMYNELLKAPKSVDLICPSEYMIMKMISEGLIREFDTPQNLTDYGSKYINNVFKGLKVKNQAGENVSVMREDESKTYAVGYMWGTIGLIYNQNLADGTTLTDDDFKSWSAIWEKFEGRVTIKDSIRDSYFLALAYVYQDELLEVKSQYEQDGNLQVYSEKLAEIFNRTDEDTIKDVENALLDLKSNLYGFEVDAGKSDILTGKIDVNFAWSGDAVYSLEQGLYDEDGNELDNPVYLGYAVPEEGANVWFDGYVMTKDADYDNSLKFLDFLCDPEIAVANMDYTGYTSCIAGNSENNVVFEYVLDSYGVEEGEGGTTCNLAYFFEPTHTGDDYIVTVSDLLLPMFNAQYPSEEIINRCAVMRNFSGEELERINDMWSRIKLTTLPTWAIWLIVGGIAFAIALFLVIKFRDKIFVFKCKEQNEKKDSKYQVIKKEKIF